MLRRAVLAVVLASVVLAVPAAASAAVQRYGFNDNAWSSGYPQNGFLDKLTGSGASYLRTFLDWGFEEQVQGQPRSTYWSQWDALYNQSLARGFKLDYEVLGAPLWALTTEGRSLCSPTSPECKAPPDVRRPEIRDAWKAWIKRVLQRYPQLGALEVWNEPNIRVFWTQSQDPDLYGLMLLYARQAAQEIGSTVPILTGGFAAVGQASSQDSTKLEDIVDATYRVAGAGSFDALSFHAYPCKTIGYATSVQNVVNRVAARRDVAGDTAKPLWITETGVSSASGGTEQGCSPAQQISEDEQASALAAILDYFKQRNAQQGDLPVVMVHQLIDRNARTVLAVSNANEADEWGLVAWSKNPTSGAYLASLDKPAYAKVSCKFKGTC